MISLKKPIISVRLDNGTYHYYLACGECCLKFALDAEAHEALKRQQGFADLACESQNKFHPDDPLN